MKNRIIIKKELKTIAKSKIKLDKQLFEYFMENVDSIKFNDREIIYLIHNLVQGYFYEKDDFEYKIADFIFTKTSIKNHPKLDMLFVESFVNNCNAVFELLIKHNVVIEEVVVKYMEDYLGSIEFNIYHYIVQEIDDYRDKLNVIKLYTRKQKIENIRNKKRAKI